MLLGYHGGTPEWDTAAIDIVIGHHPAKVWTTAEKLDLAADAAVGVRALDGLLLLQHGLQPAGTNHRANHREGRHYSCRVSCGVSVVLLDEAAEAVMALDRAGGGCRRWLVRLRWLELERAMRPLRVVVLDEDAQDALEVAAVEDQ